MQNEKRNCYLFTCENETHWLKTLVTQLSLSTKPIRIAVTIHKTTLGKPMKLIWIKQTPDEFVPSNFHTYSAWLVFLIRWMAPQIYFLGADPAMARPGQNSDLQLRRTFFPAYFHLPPLQKHVRKLVSGFGKKSYVRTGVRKPGNIRVPPTGC